MPSLSEIAAATPPDRDRYVVLVACTHGLFIGGAKEKLLAADCDEIISTDTIETEFSKVSVAECIATTLFKSAPHIKN